MCIVADIEMRAIQVEDDGHGIIPDTVCGHYYDIYALSHPARWLLSHVQRQALSCLQLDDIVPKISNTELEVNF